MKGIAFLLLLVAAADCGGRSPLGAGSPEEDPTVSAPEACDSPDGPPVIIGSTPQLTATIVGRWWLCSGVGVFPPGTAAVELTADRRWYALKIAGTRLGRAEGPGLAGTWSPASEARGLNIREQAALAYTDVGRGSEQWFIYPTFSQSPPKMKFDWRHAVYVRVE